MPRVQSTKRNSARRANNSYTPAHPQFFSNPLGHSSPAFPAEPSSSSSSSASTPSSTATTGKTSTESIPRPPNSWILFRSDRVHKITKEWEIQYPDVKLRQNKLSKLISVEWQGLSFEEREGWDSLATEKAAEHKRLYPDYVYRPKKRAQQQPKDTKAEPAIPATRSGGAALPNPGAPDVDQASPPLLPVPNQGFVALDMTSSADGTANEIPNFAYIVPTQPCYPEFEFMNTPAQHAEVDFATQHLYMPYENYDLFPTLGMASNFACSGSPYDSGYSMQQQSVNFDNPLSLSSGFGPWY